MKNKQFLDLLREIRKSSGRFISIFFIVLLGTAFFSGLRSSGLAMKLSADAYYDDTNLMDVKLLTTLGLTDQELDFIKQVDGVSSVVGSHTLDVLLQSLDKEFPVKLIEYHPQVNEPFLLSGRLPKSKEEALIDERIFKKEGYAIGDKMQLKSGNKENLSKHLAVSEVTIVGSCHLPYFLEIDRGSSKIGDGSIDAFLVLLNSAFQSDLYSEAYITFQDTKPLLTYSNAYQEKVSPIIEKLKALEEKIAKSRYDMVFKEASEKISDAKTKLRKGKKELKDAKQTFESGFQELDLKRQELDQKETYAKRMGADKKTLVSIEAGKKALQTEEKKLQAAYSKYETELPKKQKEISSSEKKLEKAKKDLQELSLPEVYFLDREKMGSYVSFLQNADRMDNIGNVFPVIFFLVAALVSLTAMTRMVDENRITMGTLKALGFSNASIIGKYLTYSLFATISGSVIGILLGEHYLPLLIQRSYQTLFIGMPYALTPFNQKEALLALLAAVLSTGLATFASSYKSLRESPASLMRPLPPKHGKRVLLERLPFIWKRLNFTGKSTIRNLVRYKKRFIMTVIGIGGCMGLLLVGFGLRDSIQEIAKEQYINLFTYDARMTVSDKAKKEQLKEVKSFLSSYGGLRDFNSFYYKTVDLEFENTLKPAFLLIPDKEKNLEEYFILKDSESGQRLPYPKENIYLTKKIADLLNVEVGDEVFLSKEGSHKVSVKVERIVENYMFHYIFLSKETYKSLYGKAPKFNNLFLSYDSPPPRENSLGEILLNFDSITGVYFVSELKENINTMLNVLNLVIFVLISSAGLLAFVVLYNLNSINVMERKRELATLKVLGFYDGEVSSYVYRENIILTVFGILAGILFGTILHRYVVQTVEIDLMMFGRSIRFLSYILSIVITFVFSFFVNLVMHFILKKINMIESLKSVE